MEVVKLEPGDDFALIQQEIVMMRDCRHPNIVAYFGSYLRSHKLWIAMEYCGGGSLQDIYHSPPLPSPLPPPFPHCSPLLQWWAPCRSCKSPSSAGRR